MHRASSRAHIASLVLRRDDLMYAIVPAAAAAGFVAHAAASGSSAGVSDVVGAAERTPDAAQEALWALGIAEANNAQVVRYGEGARLLMPRSPAEARSLVDQVLGEMLGRLRCPRIALCQHGAGVCPRRRLLAACRGRDARAQADARVPAAQGRGATGRGFVRTQHVAEWWFALQALDLLAACGGQPDPVS